MTVKTCDACGKPTTNRLCSDCQTRYQRTLHTLARISQHDIAKTLGIPYRLLSITLAKERTNTTNDSENLRRMRKTSRQQTLL